MDFANTPKLHFVIGALGVFFVLEHLFPLRTQRRPLLPRLVVNALLSLGTYSAAALVMRPVTLKAMQWGLSSKFGILQWVALPPVLAFITGFLLLDLSFYYWHRLNHTAPLLWRFHNVHHSDPDMDASTGFRFHFAEILISTLFRVVQVLVIGADLSTFLIFELVFQIATYFHHSNLKLPAAVDRLLNVLVVTPRMHTIHHSQVRQETNSNYSVIFSLWDRVHRSFRNAIPTNAISIGVAGYATDADNHIGSAIKAPFVAQRDYWRGNLKRGQ